MITRIIKMTHIIRAVALTAAIVAVCLCPLNVIAANDPQSGNNGYNTYGNAGNGNNSNNGNDNEHSAYGGGPGNNNNAPSANGGGYAAPYPETVDGSEGAAESGEVLGMMDTDSTAIVGIVIAILIAIAVIVLILALIPRGSTGV